MLSSIEVKRIKDNAPFYCEERYSRNLEANCWLFITPLQDVNGNFFYYAERISDQSIRITGVGTFVTDEYSRYCRRNAYKEWYENAAVQHLWDTSYTMLNSYPAYDRDFCESFMVTKDWLASVLEDGETVEEYLDHADWGDNYQILLHADAVGAILYQEMTDTGANMLDLLGRLRSDCLYFLGEGRRNPDVLWAHDVKKQIAKMKELWNALLNTHRPAWLTWEQIENFEKQMLDK